MGEENRSRFGIELSQIDGYSFSVDLHVPPPHVGGYGCKNCAVFSVLYFIELAGVAS